MADQQDLNASSAVPPVEWDRAIFTSLPSPTGEGYRFVAWSTGLRIEERTELTRRAPSHGSLSGEGASPRGLLHLRVESTGRTAWGFVRVCGAEHTRRGGGRVWTDFLVGDPLVAARAALHPESLRVALAAQPALKQPVASAALPRVAVTRRAPAEPAARDANVAAAVAGLLVDGRPCVVAAGEDPAGVFEDAIHRIPATLRGAIRASAGLRFSPARGVKTTVTDRIDQDTVRATRGQGVECIDLEAKRPPPPAPMVAWLDLMSRWWSEGRAADAVALAERVGAGWTVDDLPRIAAIAESADRGELSGEALDDFLGSRAVAV